MFVTGTSWVLLAAAVAAAISIGIGIVVHRARKVETSAQDHPVLEWCVAHGHAYAIHHTGWRCGVCGNYVARREGELYGRPEEGHVDRRREDRPAA